MVQNLAEEMNGKEAPYSIPVRQQRNLKLLHTFIALWKRGRKRANEERGINLLLAKFPHFPIYSLNCPACRTNEFHFSSLPQYNQFWPTIPHFFNSIEELSSKKLPGLGSRQTSHMSWSNTPIISFFGKAFFLP